MEKISAEHSRILNSVSFLPTVPVKKPTSLVAELSTYMGEVGEKVLSLDEYRQKLETCKEPVIKIKKINQTTVKTKKEEKLLEKMKKINTRKFMKDYLNSIGKQNPNKKSIKSNAYFSKINKREGIEKSLLSGYPEILSTSDLPLITSSNILHQKNVGSEILPLKHRTKFPNMNLESNTTLDGLIGDTSQIFSNSQLPNHNIQHSYNISLTNHSDLQINPAKITKQLRKLDYENNKVNTLLKLEKNNIVKLNKKIDQKFKVVHYKYLMTENEKELQPETRFENNDEPIFEKSNVDKQLSRVINNLQAIRPEEAKEIIKKNKKNYLFGESVVRKRVNEEKRKRELIHKILEKSLKIVKNIGK